MDSTTTGDITDIVKEQQNKGVWKDIFMQGVWYNNGTLVQMLGLCPMLAVSNTVTNSLGLGLATMLVLIFTNTAVSSFRRVIPHEVRIPIYVTIIASTVTIVGLFMQAYAYNLYASLGIFMPLIVTNCIVIGRAEAYASKNPVKYAAFDGFAMGLGMTLVLITLGAFREILGNGTLFSGIDQLVGNWAAGLEVNIIPTQSHFLLAILPPGAFIGLALLLALKNAVTEKLKSK